MINIKRADPFLLVLLGVSLALNVYQYRRPIALHGSAPELLRVGQQLPPFAAKTLDGVSYRRSRDTGRPAILYAFSPSCSWCARNLANAQAVAHQTKGTFDFVAVALSNDGLKKCISDNQLDWTIVNDVPEDILSAYRLYGTPATIVLDRDNKVLHAWSGAFSGNVSEEVERALAVKLPGLLPSVYASSHGDQQ
jgi:peroxiredoxin